MLVRFLCTLHTVFDEDAISSEYLLGMHVFDGNVFDNVFLLIVECMSHVINQYSAVYNTNNLMNAINY